MSKNLFNSVELTRPSRNAFDLTHDVKMSGKMGELLPVLAMECVPGDTIRIGADVMIRFAPILAPLMHRVDFTIHYFAVPMRILWENFEEFITNNPDVPTVMPTINVSSSTTADVKRFLDYFGIPPVSGGQTYKINAHMLAAYQAIYNEYYRDQNLINPVSYALVDGDNTGNAELTTLRYRAWEHDYFTASLPFAQKGAAVDIPLGDITLRSDWSPDHFPAFVDSAMNPSGGTAIQLLNGGPSGPYIQDNTSPENVAYDPKGSLVVDATTINDLRQAFQLQKWLERNALGGTRYVEHIWAHFGVKSSDARLQRPEYITGVKAPIIISEVLNTTGPTDFWDGSPGGGVTQTGSPQGSMTGHGVGVTSGKLGSYFCEEHTYIIGILSVMPKTAYQQGIPKHALKTDFLEYYWPTFAHLGEQEVLQKEIYVDTTAPNQIFGYVPRYAEYRYLPSRVAGDFRTSLDFWHLGRIFSGDPTLSQDFIECTPDQVARIFAVQTDTDNLWMHVLNKITAIRPMPFYATPSGM